MTKQTIKLNKSEIRNKIETGNTDQGCHYLTVNPVNATTTIHWADTNRPWDPWGDDDYVIGLPALYPAGDGGEADDAEECLVDNLGKGAAKDLEDRLDEADISITDYANEHYPEWMLASHDNQLDFLEQAFLDACNGDGDDLNDPAPWGIRDCEEIIEPPFIFEWAE